jgi:hypothetical protein
VSEVVHTAVRDAATSNVCVLPISCSGTLLPHLFFSVQYFLAQAATPAAVAAAAAVVVAAAGQLRQATTKLCCGTVFYALLTQTL